MNDLEFIYEQRSGCLYLASRQDERVLIACGYSGKGRFLNELFYEDRVAEGVIPRGVWRIVASVAHSKLGPVCLALAYGRDAGGPVVYPHGRRGFYIHGDNAAQDRSASSGCVVLDRTTREFIANSRVKLLNVVSGV